MAIGKNNHGCVGSGGGWPTSVSYVHTVSAQPNRILIAFTSTAATTVTYGGVALLAIPGLTMGWYMINPPTGAATLFGGWAGATKPCIGGIDLYGVDQVNPFRDIDSAAMAGVTQVTINSSAVPGDMMVCGVGNEDNESCGNHTMQAPLVNPYDCCATAASTVVYNQLVALSHGLATVSPQPVQIQGASAWNSGTFMALALRPYVPALGRTVRYYFNIWDPKAQVRDRNDRPVPPNELEPDSWLEVQGHVLPDSAAYETFIVDPTKARIVEVTATERGAVMRANRSQFADVLISRASAGRA